MSTDAIPAAGAACAGVAKLYRRRRPERTLLYRLVQRHLSSWLAESRERDPDGLPVPAHIERELRGYLACGILAHGFARARCGGCGHDFLLAFSCKGRGVCPSCTTRRMAETAAHLVEHVFPKVPVRQWVITFPKRLRYFLHRDPALLNRLLPIVLRAIETRLRSACPGAPRAARFGAVSFPQRFGSALNAHLHLHCCITDGVFSQTDGELRFHAAQLTDADLQAIQRQIRTRALRAAVRQGALTPEAAEDLGHWAHGGGFSLHAGVWIEAEDRPALERLLRYCARPAFASERLEALGEPGTDERIRYTFPKPRPDGQTTLTLTPLELLDRIAALVPPPRRHRHHYHGVFAPHSPLRRAVTACAGKSVPGSTGASAPGEGIAPPPPVPPDPPETSPAEPAGAPPDSPARRAAAYAWVRLLARIYELLPLICPRCGTGMRLIAFITQPDAVAAILTHLGEPTTPPPLAPRARAPPELDFTAGGEATLLDQSSGWEASTLSADPGYAFDQTAGA
jgi:hypothetical protein